MIQIISGKFFNSDDRNKFNAYSSLYSNYSWVGTIELEFANLLVDFAHNQNDSIGYVFHYLNQIENDKNSVLVRTGDPQIIQQFQNICTFGFQAIFDTEERIIMNLCKPKSPYITNQSSSELVRRYFDSKIHGTIEEVEQFKILFENIIALPRKDFEIILKCIEAFSNSLKILNYNFDLAYSMLIYCLETLNQKYDGYQPLWKDYENSIELDNVLSNINNNVSDEIRDIIIKDSNFKLSRRFTEFIINNTKESFFTVETVGVERPLRRSEFEAVLRNAYKMRSSYAHSLQPILEHIKSPIIAKLEIFTYSNEPFFTYNGLLRLTHHLINNIIFDKEFIEKEEINWSSKLPGILTMELDPKYWIGKTKNFDENSVKMRFSAFLSQYFNALTSKNSSITESNELMELYESKIFTAKKENQQSMIVHYLLYNLVAPNSNKCEKFDVIGRNIGKNRFLERACIDNLFFCIFTNQKYFASYEACNKIYINYLKSKTKEKSLVLPQLAEIFVLLYMANRSIEDGYYDKYEYWLNLAYLESSGLKLVQDEIERYWNMGNQINSNMIFHLFKK